MSGALAGVTVLDLGRVVAGAYCGMLLADMGATVIKVEAPHLGDDTRGFGPYVDGESAFYTHFNRNKKGITLNLKSKEGCDILCKLVENADILIENFRPGTMERFGVGYNRLHEINPKLVYGSVTGFGSNGPYRDRPGYDIIAQAMSGLISVTGVEDGTPVRAGTSFGDIMGGISLALGVVSAYVYAGKTGKGQFVDVSLTDSLLSALMIVSVYHLNGGVVPKPTGNRYLISAPYDSFHTADDDIVVACGNNKLFRQLTEVMGRPDLRDNPLFAQNETRKDNHLLLKRELEEWLSGMCAERAVDILLQGGIPAGRIQSIDQVVLDAHFSGAREMFPVIKTKKRKFRITANHIKMNETPTEEYQNAPALGEHTLELLSKLAGLNPEDIQALKQKDIV